MKTAIQKLSWAVAISGILVFLISAPLNAKQNCTGLVWEGSYEVQTEEDIEGLSGYTSVAGTLIVRNSSLTNLKGLECLESVGDLYIENNDYLINLKGLEGLTEIGFFAFIRNNNSLKNLKGLENLQIVQFLGIYDNASLISLRGLKNYNGSMSLTIENNDSLKNLRGIGEANMFDGVIGVEDLKIWDNNSLIRFGVTIMCPGYLSIRNNQSLKTLNGLKCYGGPVEIDNNDSLKNLDDTFEFLTDTPNLSITNNDSLESLSGLENLWYVHGFLTITYNSELCTSAAEALRDQVLNGGGIDGDVIIAGNKDC